MSKKKMASMQAMPSMDKVMDGGPDDHEAASAHDTIMRAHEHMQDEPLMERVKKHAGRKIKAMTGMAERLQIHSLDDLRKLGKSFKKKDKMAGDGE